MKTATLFTPPNRRVILLAHREEIEQKQAQRERSRQRKHERELKVQKRKELLTSPAFRIFSKLGSVFWTLAISLILTLFASYLVMNPQALTSLTQPFERSFRQIFAVKIAGAAPVKDFTSAQAVTQKRDVEISVERFFNASYLGKDDEIVKALGSSRKYSKQGFRGDLKLAKIEITPVVNVFSEKVDKVEEYDQLPSNDLSELPAEKIFNVRCDKELGAMRDLSLKAAEWEWDIQEHDIHGLPLSYKAKVTFRGEEQYLDYCHLVVSARYKGEVEKAVKADTVKEEKSQSIKSSPALRPTSDDLASGPARPASQGVVEVIINEPVLEEFIPEELAIEDEGEVRERYIPITIEPEIEEPILEGDDKGHLTLALAGLTVLATAGGGATVVFYRRRKKQEE